MSGKRASTKSVEIPITRKQVITPEEVDEFVEAREQFNKYKMICDKFKDKAEETGDCKLPFILGYNYVIVPTESSMTRMDEQKVLHTVPKRYHKDLYTTISFYRYNKKKVN